MPLRIIALLSLVLGSSAAIGAPPHNEAAGPIGWATVGEGTTGGGDAEPVEVADAKALEQSLQGHEPKVVHVKGTIALPGSLRVGSNTSLVGVGDDAKLIGGGLHVRKVENVIIRNLTITEADDAVGVQASHHVWIDHCDLSNCRDGLVDITRGSDFVTVSWNRFHDHHKTCLLGHSDKPTSRAEDSGRLRVTFHHNYFDGTNSRHPRVRFADPVHVFNNYYRGNSYGVASVMDAGVIVEGNYFEDVRQPTLTAYGDSPEPGRLVEVHNALVRSGKPQSRGEVDRSRLKYDYRLDPAAEVPEIVIQGSGVGKLGE